MATETTPPQDSAPRAAQVDSCSALLAAMLGSSCLLKASSRTTPPQVAAPLGGHPATHDADVTKAPAARTCAIRLRHVSTKIAASYSNDSDHDLAQAQMRNTAQPGIPIGAVWGCSGHAPSLPNETNLKVRRPCHSLTHTTHGTTWLGGTRANAAELATVWLCRTSDRGPHRVCAWGPQVEQG